MRTKLLFFCFILYLLACNEHSSQKKFNNNTDIESTENCFSKKDKEKAIEAILKNKDFQLFLHPEVKSRLPVKLMKNEFVSKNLLIYSNGKMVTIKDSLVLPDGDINRLTIKNVNCNPKSFGFSIFYPIEGSIIQGDLIKTNNEWIVNVTGVGEM